MTTIILLAISIGLNIVQFVNNLTRKDERDYWYKLYNQLLEENKEEAIFLNKRDVERLGKIEILVRKIIEEHKNKHFGIGTADIINAHNNSLSKIKTK